MSDSSTKPRPPGFAKTFVYPALLIFAVPLISLLFFRHVESSFDEDALTSITEQVNQDGTLSPEEKAAAIEYFTENPISTQAASDDPQVDLPAETTFYFATFRWMIRLSWWSLAAGLGVLAIVGACVPISMRSPRAQYLCLSVGWHLLRVYGALQAVVIGVLLVALSFWVTAFWFDVYFIKLIFIAGALALVAIGAVLSGIFKRIPFENEIAGQPADPVANAALFSRLQEICELVGTRPPDNVILGIDNNFFVTQMPVTVNGRKYEGRTLFVSLSLLKQLHDEEADAILAHEMAHFSGNDTLYSKKISPLLQRYNHYLGALQQGGAALPVFYFMNFFRALFELSISKLSREREFRADRIAQETTSAPAMAGALTRVIAYSAYRRQVEEQLFDEEALLEQANVAERIEQGFPAFAASFLSQPDVGELESAHPFDSHPPLAQRLEAIGLRIELPETHSLLAQTGNGRWFERITDAAHLERAQWSEFEEKFRNYHAESLPYRYLPETDEEREVVARHFPPVSFTGKEGELTVDFEKIVFERWNASLAWRDITNLQTSESGELMFPFLRNDKIEWRKIKLKKFPDQQAILEVVSRYWGRCQAAVAYREHRAEMAAKKSEKQASTMAT